MAVVLLSFSEPGFGVDIDAICLEQSLLLPRSEQHAFKLQCAATLQDKREQEEAARASQHRHGAGQAVREHADR